MQQPAVLGGYQESEDPGDDHGAVDLEQSRQGVGAALPMAIIGATAVKVTPWISGSLTPTLQKPTDWIMEAIPHVKRSALMSWTSCSFVSPIAAARSSGTITAPA